MEFKILYWYWLVFGMLLIMAEIFSSSENAKVVVLPADFPAAIKGLLNTAGKSG